MNTQKTLLSSECITVISSRICTLLCSIGAVFSAEFRSHTLYIIVFASAVQAKLNVNFSGTSADIVRKTIEDPCCYFLATPKCFQKECRRRRCRMYSCELITSCSRTHWFSWHIDSRDQRFNANENDS